MEYLNKKARVMPLELRFEKCRPTKQALYPPAETIVEREDLDSMWFGGLSGDVAGKPVRREDEAILVYGGEHCSSVRWVNEAALVHAAVFLAKRIGLDRLFLLSLLNPEFSRPCMLPQGYNPDPWKHMNHFEHEDVTSQQAHQQRVWRILVNWGYFDHLKEANRRRTELMQRAHAFRTERMYRSHFDTWIYGHVPDLVSSSEDDAMPACFADDSSSDSSSSDCNSSDTDWFIRDCFGGSMAGGSPAGYS